MPKHQDAACFAHTTPSEAFPDPMAQDLPAAVSDFKKKLVVDLDLLRSIIADLSADCGVEIERLRTMGLLPADKLPRQHSLVIDSTDVEASDRPCQTSRETGEETKHRMDFGYKVSAGAAGPVLFDDGKQRQL